MFHTIPLLMLMHRMKKNHTNNNNKIFPFDNKKFPQQKKILFHYNINAQCFLTQQSLFVQKITKLHEIQFANIFFFFNIHSFWSFFLSAFQFQVKQNRICLSTKRKVKFVIARTLLVFVNHETVSGLCDLSECFVKKQFCCIEHLQRCSEIWRGYCKWCGEKNSRFNSQYRCNIFGQ